MRAGLVFALLCLGAACDSAGGATEVDRDPGTKGGACYPNKTCNAGLKCVDRECIGTAGPLGEGGRKGSDGGPNGGSERWGAAEDGRDGLASNGASDAGSSASGEAGRGGGAVVGCARNDLWRRRSGFRHGRV